MVDGEMGIRTGYEGGLIMSADLKLYVWTGFNPDAVGGLAIAIAETVDEAKELVKAAHQPCCVWDWGTLTIHDIDKCAHCVAGDGGITNI